MHRIFKPLSILAVLALLQAPLPVYANNDSETQASQILTRALGLIRENRNQEAAVELRKAVALVPDSAKAHHSLGLALAKIGDNDGAVKSFIKAIELNPNLDSAWLTLGGFYQSMGKLDEALVTYDAFLDRFKNKPETADSCKKVAALREGLEKERDRLKRTRDETAALQASYPQLKNSLLNAPAQSALDDYVPEATRQGHIHRWAKVPIKVYVHDARGVPGYKPAWGAILQQSFRDWESASNGAIKFEFVDEPPQDGLDVMWVAVAGANAGLQQEAEAGEAVMYTLNDDLHHGTIKILTKSFSSVLPLTDNRIRFICLHEIGHALGLSGHTDNPEDVMFLSTSFRDEWRDLTGRDARTIQRLYTGK
jgi:tetratricopeptide (TPR) repeat protein